MAMSTLELQLREMMKCKVCLEVKENQKQLPCQHTLCLECLGKMAVAAAKFSCPLCDEEFLVPNGGLKALPDSLSTKQLAGLIQPGDSTAGATQSTSTQQPPDTKVQTAAACKSAIARSTEILISAEKKINDYVEMEKALTQKADDMKEKLSCMRNEIINQLNTRVDKKMSGIDEVVQMKKEEISKKCQTLKEAYNESKALISKLNNEEAGDDVNAELSRFQASLGTLKDQMQQNEPSKGKLRQGDSVKLNMDDQLEKDFLENDVDHSDVGYIFRLDDDGDCKVLFPTDSTWSGKVKMLERSSTKHELPLVGDSVKVKPSVEVPTFDWGNVTHQSVGILKKIENGVIGDDRVVEIDFPESSDWKCRFKEIEKTAPPPLQVGDKVWMAKDVSEPVRGWSGVTPVSVGTLISINGDDVVVNFPECTAWQGLLSELEKTRSIIVGDIVKVKKGVETPTTQWAGVTHQDEGEVVHIRMTDEQEELAHIKMPNRSKPWKCLVNELDIVKRCLTPKTSQGKIGISLGELLARRREGRRGEVRVRRSELEDDCASQ